MLLFLCNFLVGDNKLPYSFIKVKWRLKMSVDLDKRSKVINLCPWDVSFTLPNSKAEQLLEKNKTTTINNAELITLCENQDIMFFGTENGNHARIFIDNNELREHVGFDNPEEKQFQFVLSDEECAKIFELKTDSTFEKHIKNKVVLFHEKAIIMEYARKIKLNDYGRIKFLEEYTENKY